MTSSKNHLWGTRYRDLPNLISHLKKSHVPDTFRDELNQLYTHAKKKHSVLMDVSIEETGYNVTISLNYHLCEATKKPC